MPDEELEAYYAQKRARQGNESNSGGLWGRAKDAYDKLDYDWLPEYDSSVEDWGRSKGFGRVADVVGGARRSAYALTNSLIGGPVRTLGTVGSIATMGAGGLVAKAPQIARGVSNIARGIDAAQTLRSGGQAIEDVRQGNYGSAVGSAVGAGLAGGGAVFGGVRTKPKLPDVAPPLKEGLKVAPLNVNQAELPNIPTLPEMGPVRPPSAMFDKQVIVRPQEVQAPVAQPKAPPPAMFSRQVIRPPERLALPEHTEKMLKGKRVPGPTEDILERGAREFNLLGLPANAKALNRYRYDTEFRSTIQAKAGKIEQQTYSPTDKTKFVMEAPTPSALPKNATVDDVRKALEARGVDPSNDQLVARVRRDPALLDRLGLRPVEMEGSVMPKNQVRGLLPQHAETPVSSIAKAEVPEPKVITAPITRESIREDLISRGVTDPSDLFVARILNDTDLQKKMGMGQSTFDSAGEVKGLLGPRKLEPVIEEEFVQGSLFSKSEMEELTPADKVNVIIASPKVPQELKEILSQAKVPQKDYDAWRYWRTGSMVSQEEELGRLSPELAREFKRASTDADIRFSNAVRPVQDRVTELAKTKDFDKYIPDYLEGRLKLEALPEDIRPVAQHIQKLYKEFGTAQNELGLLEKGPVENYWRRMYDNDDTVRDAMKKQGKSEDQIKEALNYIKAKREMKTGAENVRTGLDIPGYRKDADVFLDDLREKSKRIEQATRFGAKDLNDPDSPISKMIANSSDPERAKNLAQRMLRGAPVATEDGNQAAKFFRKYSVVSALGQAGISNFGGILPITMKSSIGEVATSLREAIQATSPNMKSMDASNLYRKFSGGFAEVVGDKNRAYRLYGIEQGQNLLNRLAGATGAGHSEVLLAQLKANPTSQKIRKQLEDLTLEDADVLVKQDALTPHQTDRAMRRMSELTQAVSEGRKLPYLWNQEGITQVPLTFMKTAFQTTKTVVDAVKQDPVRNLPRLAAVGWALGEVIGDTKELISTGAQVATNSVQQRLGVTEEDLSFGDQYLKNIGLKEETRSKKTDRLSFPRKQFSSLFGEEAAKNDYYVRAWANLQQAFALGLPADILESVVGDELPGFAASEGRTAWNVGRESIAGVGEALLTGDMSKLGEVGRNVGREAVKRLPVVGRPISREIQTPWEAKKEAKGETKGAGVRRMRW